MGMEPETKRFVRDSDSMDFARGASAPSAGKQTPVHRRYDTSTGGNDDAERVAAEPGSEAGAREPVDMFGGLLEGPDAADNKKGTTKAGATFAAMNAKAKRMLSNVSGYVPDPGYPVRDVDEATNAAIDIRNEAESKLRGLTKDMAAFEKRIGQATGAERAALNKEFDRIQDKMDQHLYKLQRLLITAGQGLRGKDAAKILRGVQQRLWKASKVLATRRWGSK